MSTYNADVEELVADSGINKLCPDFATIYTLEDLQALEIFDHLEGEDKDDAETTLLADIPSFPVYVAP